MPIIAAGPQAFGWFKRPIRKLADFKGMKCRQTGMAAEVWRKMGMTTVAGGRRQESPRRHGGGEKTVIGRGPDQIGRSGGSAAGEAFLP